ncbi:ferritin-like domain-containing protein [Halorubrum tibetense]|uniref:Ferritin-like domain-containing protein n=1 Tax=Halorubrum tibetense TaxID=175631 RepID=A0ABD5SH57_9EURY
MENIADDDVLENSANNTRRQFVAGTAGALGGLAAGVGLVAPVSGDEHDENGDDEDGDDEETNGEDPEPIENEFEDDVAILNYARTLELLEADFYRQALENISEEELCTCNMLQADSALAERAYDELVTIQEHEETHADVLGETIEALGGEPVEDLEFDFGLRVEYAEPFLATAAMLEDIGVSAYAGAAPFIENEDLVAPALSIHSVEARHASFVRTLTSQTGFPTAFDEARSRSEVLELAAPFIVGEEEEDDEEGENGDDTDEDENGTDEGEDETGNGENGDGTDEGENGTDEGENGTDEGENGTDEGEDETSNGENGNGTDEGGDGNGGDV